MLGISLLIFVLSVGLASSSFEVKNLENKKIDSAIIPIEGTQAKNIKEIAVIPEGGLFIDAKISPDLKKFAYAYKKDNKYFIGASGAEEQSYKWVYDLTISPDGQRIGYIAQRNARYFTVINGVEGPEYDDIGYISATDNAEPYYYIKGLNFSLNGQRTAYFNKNDHNIHLVLDGQEGSACDCSYALDPVFSPDSKKVAFVARKNNKYKVVVDKAESELYDRVGKDGRTLDLYSDEIIFFSPDSQKYAFIAKKDGKEFVVINGVTGKAYSGIKDLRISPDNRIFYIAETEEKQVVVDEIEGKMYSAVSAATLRFSADGKRSGYIASAGSQNFLVIDGQEIVIEEGVNPQDFIFSPDGQSFSYIAKQADDTFYNVTGGVKGTARNYNSAADLAYSPDGKKLAYKAFYTDKGASVFTGEEEGKLYERLSEASPIVFSSDSQKIAYVAQKGEELFVVLNSSEEKSYQEIRNITFSADSKNIFYLAKKDNKVFLVINGKEKEPYDEIMAPAFSADGKKVVYGARDGNKLLQVENKID